MNYKKIYDSLMISRLEMKPNRIVEKKNGAYFEGHHIIPKCKGGSGVSTRPKNNKNIVLLTSREHFLSHWLLWRIYGDRQMALAFHKMMSTTKNIERITSSRGYAEAREAFKITNIGNQYGKGKTKIISDEQKKVHSLLMKGRYCGEKNYFFGKKHSEETKEKMKEKRKGFNKEKIWNYRGKKIILKNDEIIKICDTTEEVASFIDCSVGNVRHVLCGAQKTARGYVIKHYTNL